MKGVAFRPGNEDMNNQITTGFYSSRWRSFSQIGKYILDYKAEIILYFLGSVNDTHMTREQALHIQFGHGYNALFQ
jgi:hypothetical protein